MKRISLLLIATVVLASCGGNKKSDDKSAQHLDSLKKVRADLDAQISKIEADNKLTDTSIKPIPVTVMALKPATFNGYVEVQSQVTGDENVYANAQAPGTITSILVKPGQHVSQGQTLATLDAAALEQQIKALDAQYQLAKSVYEKQQKLWEQNIGTEVQLLQAKANAEASLKQKEATMAQRNMYRIVSPISGVVDQVDAKIGQVSGPTAPNTGIRVVNSTQLKAEANLGENYIGKVHTGDRVMLIFPDINDSMETKISYVAQAVDPVSRAFNVQIRLGSVKNLHPNMSCRMRIINYEAKDALAIPISIIQKTAEGDKVFIAEGNKAKSVPITIGKYAGGQAEVLSGLKAGDNVIIDGYRELDNGQLIQAR